MSEWMSANVDTTVRRGTTPTAVAPTGRGAEQRTQGPSEDKGRGRLLHLTLCHWRLAGVARLLSLEIERLPRLKSDHHSQLLFGTNQSVLQS